MQTRAKATQVFEVRIWSKKHFGEKLTPVRFTNIYNGFIIDAKTKEKKAFDSAGQLLKAVEELYIRAEKSKQADS
ncbi:hypothetical protein HYX06_03480 [Candidatus Woesearchaeota archaeon]|nr:hypothetical protein [Candidatus Woesearchaeota archaeon]